MDNSLLCIHRNHHFDTMKRLHPLMHPLKTIRKSPFKFKNGLLTSKLGHKKMKC